MKDVFVNLAERYLYNEKPATLPHVVIIAGMIIAVYFLVYYTGGIKYVYSHSMYVPIIVSSLFFGIKGGIIAGLTGGLVLGPFMPIDVITGEMQQTINWIYRAGFFTLIGAITGASMDSLRNRIREINWLMHNNRYTELPNEESLNQTLERLARDDQIKRPYYLLAIGSSNISSVKNTFGFSVVHVVIQQMNQRLNECILFNHGIFNHSDEKMAVILGNLGELVIDEHLNRIVHALELPYEYENIPIHLDIHMGCVAITDRSLSNYTVERQAETALNHAIDDKLSYCIYRPEEDKTSRENVGLLGSLRNAIDTDQLVLYYQPKVDIHSRKLLGVEALVRWQHPTRGMIPPVRFIPQAEQTNLINPLTMWVMEKALSRMSIWDQQQFMPAVAVNISTRNINVPGFEDAVFRLLDKYNIVPERLELEVTESALMQDPVNAIRLLTELAESNIIISIDDFGTGYSSLEYLCKLPASIVKIDQYFIRNLVKDPAVRNIIKSATDLAHSLNMTVVAEGVEDEAVLDFLGDIGCDTVQGYHICRPIPEDELLTFARAN